MHALQIYKFIFALSRSQKRIYYYKFLFSSLALYISLINKVQQHTKNEEYK